MDAENSWPAFKSILLPRLKTHLGNIIVNNVMYICNCIVICVWLYVNSYVCMVMFVSLYVNGYVRIVMFVWLYVNSYVCTVMFV